MRILALCLTIVCATLTSAQEIKKTPALGVTRIAIVDLTAIAKYKEFSAGDLSDKDVASFWNELHSSASRNADALGIDIVLSYAKPIQEGRDPFAVVNSKMIVMDKGGMVPLYVAPSVDISLAVTNKPGAKKHGDALRGTNRVAILNIGHVYQHYKKAQAFKRAQDLWMEPLKQEVQKQTEILRAASNALFDGDFSKETEAELQAKVKSATRRIDEMRADAQGRVGSQQKQLVVLWNEFQAAVRNHAHEHDIGLVFGYGDPTDKETSEGSSEAKRKLRSMDLGHARPFFYGPNVDISADVLDLLNSGDAPIKGKKKETPTSRLATMNLAQILLGYSKAQKFKKEIAETVASVQNKEDAIKKELVQWELRLKEAVLDDDRPGFENVMKKLAAGKLKLNELRAEFDNVEKQREQNLVTLWQDITQCTRTVSNARGVGLVIANAELLTVLEAGAVANLRRKLNAVETGGTIVLFQRREAEIGPSVSTALNRLVGDAER